MLLFTDGHNQGRSIYTCPVFRDLQWGRETELWSVPEGHGETTNPRSSPPLRTDIKNKQQTVLLENNNAGATISTRDSRSFLVWTGSYLLEGEEGRGQRPGRMCFLPPFNCLGSYSTHTTMTYSRSWPRVNSPYMHIGKSNLTRY